MSISTLTKHISLRKLRKLNSLAKLYVFNKKKEISIFSFSKASQNKYQNDASQSCLLWKLLRANNKLSLKPLIGTIHFLFSPKIPPKPFCDPRIFQDFLDNINIDYFLANLLSWYLNYIIQGDFFNCSAQISVLKRKTMFSQRGSFVHWKFHGTESLIGCPSFFLLVLKIGRNSKKNTP